MAKTANIYLRLDPQVKADVETIYSRYGMTITEAVTIFLHQSRNVGGLPFDLRPETPNSATLAAMQEVEDMINGKKPRHGSFKNADDFLRDLKN
jgi:DNA-damage-inducible protein J